MYISVKDDEGKELGVLGLEAKRFSSGKDGFYGTTQCRLDGSFFDVRCMVIGHKKAVKKSAKGQKEKVKK